MCQPTSVDLNISSGSGFPVIWNTGATTTITNVFPITTSTYTVTVTNSSSGCTSSEEITVYIYDTYQPVITGDLTICQTTETTTLSIDPPPSGYAIEWSPMAPPYGSTDQATYTTSPQVTTTFTVLPQPNIQISGQTEYCVGSGNPVELTASGGSNYVWYTGGTMDVLYTGNPYTFVPNVGQTSVWVEGFEIMVVDGKIPIIYSLNFYSNNYSALFVFNLRRE
ncbi:MAG: hypothetical protein IPQ04_15280 [Saprospiraceae bacterium]|nr:hypothetical protein [Saprospiraceae bacterium]